jgi:hypothetical protein
METVNSLLKNEDFLQRIAKADTKEELQSLLAAEGIEMSFEEIDKALEAAAKQAQDGEMNEEMLENVSGGVVVAGTILVTSAFVTFIGSAGKLGLAYMTRRR